MAASNRFLNLIRYGMDLWRRRALRRALFDAQLALGERMYAAGIDDGQLAAQISAWDEKIRQGRAQKGSRKALVAERQRLLVQLAAAALAEQGPLPGADAEYQKARQAEAALQESWRPAVRTSFKVKAERRGWLLSNQV